MEANVGAISGTPFSVEVVNTEDWHSLLKDLYRINADVAHHTAIARYGPFYDHYMVKGEVDWDKVEKVFYKYCSAYVFYINETEKRSGFESKFKNLLLVRQLDRQSKAIGSVEFYMELHESITETITFPEPVTEMEAIMKLKAYLSEPVTEDYFTKIKSNLLTENEWEEFKSFFKTKCRGDTLDGLFAFMRLRLVRTAS